MHGSPLQDVCVLHVDLPPAVVGALLEASPAERLLHGAEGGQGVGVLRAVEDEVEGAEGTAPGVGNKRDKARAQRRSGRRSVPRHGRCVGDLWHCFGLLHPLGSLWSLPGASGVLATCGAKDPEKWVAIAPNLHYPHQENLGSSCKGSEGSISAEESGGYTSLAKNLRWCCLKRKGV